MKTRSLLLCCGLLVANAQAQSLPASKTETDWVMMNGHLAGGLELDTVQRRQLGEVERRYQHNYDTLLSNDSLGDAGLRLSLKGLNEQREADIKRVLTAAQYAQWQKMVAAQEHTDKR